MPKMSGRQLADLLVPSNKNMKVLYMSGFTDDTIVRHGVQEAATDFLPKPFTSLALTQKVRDVLDEIKGHHPRVADADASGARQAPVTLANP
jgi:FixJ family two-component response regulator